MKQRKTPHCFLSRCLLLRSFCYNTYMQMREFIAKYERHIGAGAIIAGFIFDSLTLARPDQLWGNVILITYLSLAAFGILLLTLYRRRGSMAPAIVLIGVQFCFGNLAGGLLVLYGRSGTFEGSFLFFAIMALFIIANEFLRNQYAKVLFNISAWYFLLFAYLALVVPILVGKIGELVFLLSGLVSLLIACGFLYLIYKISSPTLLEGLRLIVFSVGAVFLFFSALYFTNVLPPVPLSLESIGIYHTVARTPEGHYVVTYERRPWYQIFRSTSSVFAAPQKGTDAYCFSSVFAPTGLSTGVFHRWEYYDPQAGEWQTASRIPFSISGGRDSGYRGYTEKSVTEGRWRCSVETERGALIGRVTFTVKENISPQKIVEETL